MDYAVIKIKGEQYKVKEGDEILVGFLDGKKSEAEVLLTVKKGKVSVGKPTLGSTKIKLTAVNEEEKGKKIHVMKFNAKSRYRKKIGFRPKFTRLQVGKI